MAGIQRPMITARKARLARSCSSLVRRPWAWPYVVFLTQQLPSCPGKVGLVRLGGLDIRHVDGTGGGIQRACDLHVLTVKLFCFVLVVELERGLAAAVLQHVLPAHLDDPARESLSLCGFIARLPAVWGG